LTFVLACFCHNMINKERKMIVITLFVRDVDSRDI
jgi:hypothetical protein